MTVSHVWLFRKNTAGIPVFLSHALLGTIQSELSTTLKLSSRPSSTPIQLQVYIILELLHSHLIKLHIRFGLETKLTPAATRRNNYQTLPIVYSHRASNDIRATELLLNTIIMLPHIVYKLLYVAVLFIYTKKTQTLTTRTTGADCPDEREIL